MASGSPHRSHSHSRSKYVLFDKGQGEQAQQIHIVDDGGISGHRGAVRLGIGGGEALLVNLGLWEQFLSPAAPKNCRVRRMLDFGRRPVGFLAENQPWQAYRRLVTQAWNGNPLIQDLFLRLIPISDQSNPCIPHEVFTGRLDACLSLAVSRSNWIPIRS